VTGPRKGVGNQDYCIISYSQQNRNNSPYLLGEGMEMLIPIAVQTGDPPTTSARPTATLHEPPAQHHYTAYKSINARGLEENSEADQ